MATGIWVKVRKYDDYKGRGDVKKHSWFRFSNRLLEDPDFFDFSHAEILVWIYILSLASQKGSDTIFLSFAHADRICRLKKSVVQSAINKLLEKQIDPADDTGAIRGRYADDTNPGATDRQTDNTNKTNKHTLRASFETSWNLFKSKIPGSVKGPDAEDRYRAQVTDPSEIDAAIANYDRFLKLSANAWRKPKTSFETFLGANSRPFWRDFVTWNDDWAKATANGSPGFDWDKYEREKASQGAL